MTVKVDGVIAHVLENADSFMTKVLRVAVGYDSSAGITALSAKPSVYLSGPGPLYHPFIKKVLPPKSKDPDPDGCAWTDINEDLLCGLPESDHGKPRLEAKTGEWMVVQHAPTPGTMHGDNAFLHVPWDAARAVGLALIEWADKEKPQQLGDAGVLAAALDLERGRVDKLIDVVTTIAMATTENALASSATLEFTTKEQQG